MDSETRTENKTVHVLTNLARVVWQVMRLVFGYVVSLFAMSAAADLMLTGRNMAPLKVIFFPYERQACLAMVILLATLKIRKYIKANAIKEPA
jgi:hypothetical protein